MVTTIESPVWRVHVDGQTHAFYVDEDGNYLGVSACGMVRAASTFPGTVEETYAPRCERCIARVMAPDPSSEPAFAIVPQLFDSLVPTFDECVQLLAALNFNVFPAQSRALGEALTAHALRYLEADKAK